MMGDFSYKKATDEQIAEMQLIREQATILSRMIKRNLHGTEKGHLALSRLEEAIMWANKGITHG